MKIIMVCLGNICRSPLADGLLRKKVENIGIDVEVDSAGTSGHHNGEAPDERMQKTAMEFGLDISHLQSRKFIQADFDRFDLIYVMDKSNLSNVLALARNEKDKSKVKLILNEIQPDSDSEVPDPYFGGQQGFYNVYELLDSATDVILEKISQ